MQDPKLPNKTQKPKPKAKSCKQVIAPVSKRTVKLTDILNLMNKYEQETFASPKESFLQTSVLAAINEFRKAMIIHHAASAGAAMACRVTSTHNK